MTGPADRGIRPWPLGREDGPEGAVADEAAREKPPGWTEVEVIEHFDKLLERHLLLNKQGPAEGSRDGERPIPGEENAVCGGPLRQGGLRSGGAGRQDIVSKHAKPAGEPFEHGVGQEPRGFGGAGVRQRGG
jgi:hypothetical protein